jgi:hypothetical protein
VRKADNFTGIHEPVVERKCGSLDYSQIFGPSETGDFRPRVEDGNSCTHLGPTDRANFN